MPMLESRRSIAVEIAGFIWLEDIVEKLADKHRVQVEEVREVFENQPWFRYIEKGHRPGEDVYAAFGQTDAGRRLVVFFVLKRDHRALVVSAREMTTGERQRYERR